MRVTRAPPHRSGPAGNPSLPSSAAHFAPEQGTHGTFIYVVSHPLVQLKQSDIHISEYGFQNAYLLSRSTLGFVSSSVSRAYGKEKPDATLFSAVGVLACFSFSLLRPLNSQVSDFFRSKWMPLAEPLDHRPSKKYIASPEPGQESTRTKETQAKMAPKPSFSGSATNL